MVKCSMFALPTMCDELLNRARKVGYFFIMKAFYFDVYDLPLSLLK